MNNKRSNKNLRLMQQKNFNYNNASKIQRSLTG